MKAQLALHVQRVCRSKPIVHVEPFLQGGRKRFAQTVVDAQHGSLRTTAPISNVQLQFLSVKNGNGLNCKYEQGGAKCTKVKKLSTYLVWVRTVRHKSTAMKVKQQLIESSVGRSRQSQSTTNLIMVASTRAAGFGLSVGQSGLRNEQLRLSGNEQRPRSNIHSKIEKRNENSTIEHTFGQVPNAERHFKRWMSVGKAMSRWMRIWVISICEMPCNEPSNRRTYRTNSMYLLSRNLRSHRQRTESIRLSL